MVGLPHASYREGGTVKPHGLLTDRFVQRVRPEAVARNYTDGRGAHGLSLRVQPNGFRHWYQHIRIDGRYTNLGLGGYPIMTLERLAPPLRRTPDL